MNELLNVQNVTVVGLLLAAVVWLVKSNDKNSTKLFEQNKEEKERIICECNEIKKQSEENTKTYVSSMNLCTETLRQNTEALNKIPISFNVKLEEVSKELNNRLDKVEKKIDKAEEIK